MSKICDYFYILNTHNVKLARIVLCSIKDELVENMESYIHKAPTLDI